MSKGRGNRGYQSILPNLGEIACEDPHLHLQATHPVLVAMALLLQKALEACKTKGLLGCSPRVLGILAARTDRCRCHISAGHSRSTCIMLLPQNPNNRRSQLVMTTAGLNPLYILGGKSANSFNKAYLHVMCVCIYPIFACIYVYARVRVCLYMYICLVCVIYT